MAWTKEQLHEWVEDGHQGVFVKIVDPDHPHFQEVRRVLSVGTDEDENGENREHFILLGDPAWQKHFHPDGSVDHSFNWTPLFDEAYDEGWYATPDQLEVVVNRILPS